MLAFKGFFIGMVQQVSFHSFLGKKRLLTRGAGEDGERRIGVVRPIREGLLVVDFLVVLEVV